MTGKLITYENNCMSLSCKGEFKIVDGIIVDIYFKGYPRTNGDGWVYYYQEAKVGDKISQEKIDNILKYNGKYNVISVFKSE